MKNQNTERGVLRAPGPNALSARGVTKRFGAHAVLRGLDLELPRGTITALLGPNGAGKSTFLRLALGLLAPDAGSLRALGRDPRRDAAARRAIGFVPDRPDVYPWMTPRELFRFLAPQYPSWNAHRAEELAEELGLPLATRFADLSRGQATKGMLVAALAPSPPLLLLDEPFAGLDPLARDELLGALFGALSPSTTVLAATHELDVAARLADRVAVLAHGRAEVAGPVAEVLGADGEAADVPAGLKELLRASREAAGEHETRKVPA